MMKKYIKDICSYVATCLGQGNLHITPTTRNSTKAKLFVKRKNIKWISLKAFPKVCQLCNVIIVPSTNQKYCLNCQSKIRRQYEKNFYWNNIEKVKQWQKEEYIKNKEHYRKKSKRYHLQNGKERNKKQKEQYWQIKQKVINHYGPTCVCCNENNFYLLTIDHKNVEIKKQYSFGGKKLYYYLFKNGFPGGFQTMCYNCNIGRRRDECPHINPKRQSSIKMEVFKHYSKNLKCKCCSENLLNFLTIDHINGRTKRDRLSGNGLYYRLKKQNYPNEFQILCYNCNCSKGHLGVCGHEYIRRT